MPSAGRKSELATSPPRSRVPKRQRNCYVTPAFSEVRHQARGENQNWLPHPCLLEGPKEGGIATSPLRSRGSPEEGTKSRIGCLTPAFSGAQKRAGLATQPLCSRGCPQEGTKSELPASPLPCRGPKRGWNFYVTPTFLRVPRRRDKIRIGSLTPAFSGARKRVEWLRNPCVLEGAQKKGQNQNWPPHPSFLGAQMRAEWLRNPCVLGGSHKSGQNRNWPPHPTFLEVQKRAQWRRNSYILKSPQKMKQNVNWPSHPCLPGGPKEGGMATSPMCSRGFPEEGTK